MAIYIAFLSIEHFSFNLCYSIYKQLFPDQPVFFLSLEVNKTQTQLDLLVMYCKLKRLSSGEKLFTVTLETLSRNITPKY